MNLIGEKVKHMEFGIGTIIKVDKPRILKPEIVIDFDGIHKWVKYTDFDSEVAVAVRDDVQRFIRAESAATKERLDPTIKRNDFEINEKRKKISREAEELAREQLQPGETLLYCDKESSIGCFGIIFFIPSLFCIIVIVNSYFESLGRGFGDGDMATLVIFTSISLLFAWPAYHSTFQKIKNHYFITDKRLCIREVNAFGKVIQRVIPINTIMNAYTMTSKGTKRKYSSTTYLVVQTKNGNFIKFAPPSNPRFMCDALNKIRRSNQNGF